MEVAEESEDFFPSSSFPCNMELTEVAFSNFELIPTASCPSNVCVDIFTNSFFDSLSLSSSPKTLAAAAKGPALSLPPLYAANNLTPTPFTQQSNSYLASAKPLT
jgi:hypothetical protein